MFILLTFECLRLRVYEVKMLFVETPSIKSSTLMKQKRYVLFKLHSRGFQGSDKTSIKNGILISGMLGV